MNTLEQHNEEALESFANIYQVSRPEFVLEDEDYETVESFIQSQNKQLYIKIAEGEVERLTIEFNKNDYRNNDYTRIAIIEQIYHWQNILTELRK